MFLARLDCLLQILKVYFDKLSVVVFIWNLVYVICTYIIYVDWHISSYMSTYNVDPHKQWNKTLLEI